MFGMACFWFVVLCGLQFAAIRMLVTNQTRNLYWLMVAQMISILVMAFISSKLN